MLQCCCNCLWYHLILYYHNCLWYHLILYYHNCLWYHLVLHCCNYCWCHSLRYCHNCPICLEPKVVCCRCVVFVRAAAPFRAKRATGLWDWWVSNTDLIKLMIRVSTWRVHILLFGHLFLGSDSVHIVTKQNIMRKLCLQQLRLSSQGLIPQKW